MHYCTALETFSCKHIINYIWWSNSPLNVEREKSCNIIVVYKSTFNGLAAHQSESQWLRDVNQRPETMSPNHPHLKESRPSHPDRTGLRIRNPERPDIGLWVYHASKNGSGAAKTVLPQLGRKGKSRIYSTSPKAASTLIRELQPWDRPSTAKCKTKSKNCVWLNPTQTQGG